MKRDRRPRTRGGSPSRALDPGGCTSLGTPLADLLVALRSVGLQHLPRPKMSSQGGGFFYGYPQAETVFTPLTGCFNLTRTPGIKGSSLP